MAIEVEVSFFLAFAAGAVSVLSACVLPLVPGYLAFVIALTVEERSAGTVAGARGAAARHSVLFMLGFGLVFSTLGLVATPVGPPIARSLPWLQRAGGLVLAVWGLRFMVRDPSPRGPRPSAAASSAGALFTGIAFGAAWTPCIGPVFGSILLYASQEQTMAHGGALLVTYGVGLSLPFLAVSLGLNWPLAGSRSVETWAGPLRRVAGGALGALGVALVTGYFARLTAFLAGLGQLINLEL